MNRAKEAAEAVRYARLSKALDQGESISQNDLAFLLIYDILHVSGELEYNTSFGTLKLKR
jgi:hypothetical protein